MANKEKRPMLLTDDERKARSERMKQYWEQRKKREEESILPKQKSTEFAPGTEIHAEVTVKKPYTFANVTATLQDGTVISSMGFAKWDNKPSPAWDEQLGKEIATGRAMKAIKKQLG